MVDKTVNKEGTDAVTTTHRDNSNKRTEN